MLCAKSLTQKTKFMNKILIALLASVILISCEKEERGSIYDSWIVIDAKMKTDERFQTTGMMYYITYDLFDDNQHTACLITSGFSALRVDNVTQNVTKWTFDGIGEFFIDDVYAGNFDGHNIYSDGTKRHIDYFFKDGNLHVIYPESWGMETYEYPRLLPDGKLLPRGRYTIYGHSEIVFRPAN
jgi:hypothetical protein